MRALSSPSRAAVPSLCQLLRTYLTRTYTDQTWIDRVPPQLGENLSVSVFAERFPVYGCTQSLDMCNGRPRPLPPDLTLELDSTIDAAVNNRVCESCYKRHTGAIRSLDGRVRKAPTSTAAAAHLDELATVAVGVLSNHSPPPPPPPPPSPPQLLPTTALSSPSASSPLTIPPASLSSPPLPLSDIANAPLTQRRHSTPLKRKRQLVEAAAALFSPEQQAQFCAKEGVSSKAPRRYAAEKRRRESSKQTRRMRQWTQRRRAKPSDGRRCRRCHRLRCTAPYPLHPVWRPSGCACIHTLLIVR